MKQLNEQLSLAYADVSDFIDEVNSRNQIHIMIRVIVFSRVDGDVRISCRVSVQITQFAAPSVQ